MTTSASSARSLRERVEWHLGSLSPIGRRVALMLVDEEDRLGFHSATGIARRAGTSDATVIRTIQRLGYRGLADLKADIARRLAPATPTERMQTSMRDDGPTGPGALPALLDTQMRALERLAQPEMREAMLAVAVAIGSARQVLVNARGVSFGIAEHTVAHLARIGIDAATLGSAAGLTGDDLLAVRDGHLVLAIASGVPQRWQGVLYERCAEVGATVALVTDSHPPPSPSAIVVRSGRGDPAGLATHVATIAAIETIILEVASLDQGRATETLDELNRHRQRLAR